MDVGPVRKYSRKRRALGSRGGNHNKGEMLEWANVISILWGGLEDRAKKEQFFRR